MAFEINVQPVLAVGGVSGIVLGFASQEIVLNLFSGISIFLTRPFVVGDQARRKVQRGGEAHRVRTLA